MMKLVKDRVAVTPIFDADTSPGGIIIPDIAKERCDQGIVKYIGPNVKDIKIGMYVLFSGYTGTLVHIAGEGSVTVSYTHLRAHETGRNLVCRLLLEKKKKK